MNILAALRGQLTHLSVDTNDPMTVLVEGEAIFDSFEEVFDETDLVRNLYKKCAGGVHPRLNIRAVRKWKEEPDLQYDTVPDEVLEAFCDGIPSSRVLLDFTELFAPNDNCFRGKRNGHPRYRMGRTNDEHWKMENEKQTQTEKQMGQNQAWEVV